VVLLGLLSVQHTQPCGTALGKNSKLSCRVWHKCTYNWSVLLDLGTQKTCFVGSWGFCVPILVKSWFQMTQKERVSSRVSPLMSPKILWLCGYKRGESVEGRTQWPPDTVGSSRTTGATPEPSGVFFFSWQGDHITPPLSYKLEREGGKWAFWVPLKWLKQMLVLQGGIGSQVWEEGQELRKATTVTRMLYRSRAVSHSDRGLP
jgi:hypothetical protein